MSLYAITEIWQELKHLINPIDREEAADHVVNVLVDHEYDADDIRTAFKGDSDIKRALADYIDHTGDYEDEDDLFGDDDDDDY